MSFVVISPHRASMSGRSSSTQYCGRPTTGQDGPVWEDRRQFGVTRVSQVGTFGHGLVRTAVYERRCK